MVDGCSALRSSMLELAGLIQERDAVVARVRQEGERLKDAVKEQ